MGFEKAEVKMATMHNMGVKFDDMLDSAKRQMSEYDGGIKALNAAAKKIEDFCNIIDQDIENGKFNRFGDEALRAAELMKKWILRSVGTCVSMVEGAQVNRTKVSGKIEALETVITFTQNQYNATKVKSDNIKRGIASGHLTPEGEAPVPQSEMGRVIPIDDGRPNRAAAMADIAQRKAEARAEKEAAGKAATAETDATEETAKTAKKTSKPKAKKKRGRPRKKKEKKVEVKETPVETPEEMPVETPEETVEEKPEE